jgi:hypothetical protein
MPCFARRRTGRRAGPRRLHGRGGHRGGSRLDGRGRLPGPGGSGLGLGRHHLLQPPLPAERRSERFRHGYLGVGSRGDPHVDGEHARRAAGRSAGGDRAPGRRLRDAGGAQRLRLGLRGRTRLPRRLRDHAAGGRSGGPPADRPGRGRPRAARAPGRRDDHRADLVSVRGRPSVHPHRGRHGSARYEPVPGYVRRPDGAGRQLGAGAGTERTRAETGRATGSATSSIVKTGRASRWRLDG